MFLAPPCRRHCTACVLNGSNGNTSSQGFQKPTTYSLLKYKERDLNYILVNLMGMYSVKIMLEYEEK